jgi:arylsulfatase A
VMIDGRNLKPTLLGEPGGHRPWIFSYFQDERILRDKRWLLEGDGRFFDCGNERDGDYREVTSAKDAEVLAARRRFESILNKLTP